MSSGPRRWCPETTRPSWPWSTRWLGDPGAPVEVDRPSSAKAVTIAVSTRPKGAERRCAVMGSGYRAARGGTIRGGARRRARRSAGVSQPDEVVAARAARAAVSCHSAAVELRVAGVALGALVDLGEDLDVGAAAWPRRRSAPPPITIDVAPTPERQRERLVDAAATKTPSAVQPGSRVTTMLVRPGSGRPMDSKVRRPMTTAWPVVTSRKCLQVLGDVPGDVGAVRRSRRCRRRPRRARPAAGVRARCAGHTAIGALIAGCGS